MKKTRYHQHLVKPLIWQNGPEGLYPDKLFWMEGEDLEGFSANYSYQFVKESCRFHPMEGMISHPYNEVLCFASTDHDDILDLGAEVSITLGAEREEYTFTESTFVCIPAGLLHGPVQVKNVSRPFVHYTIGLSPRYQDFRTPQSALPAPVPGSRKYAELVRFFVGTIDPTTGKKLVYDPNSSVDARGVRHPTKNQHRGFTGPGNADNLLWIYGPDCMNFELNFLYSQCTGCGIWHRGGTSHAHPEEEILIVCGQNANDPFEVGAELEIAMGEEDERYAVNVPSVFIMPRGFSHLPEITRWCDKPFAFMVVGIESMHGTPWRDEQGKKVGLEELERNVSTGPNPA